MKINFKMICSIIAVRQCYNSGQSIKDIAKSAGKSAATIRKWLKVTD